MANKSGKAITKSRYTDLTQIIEEIDRESETELLQHLLSPLPLSPLPLSLLLQPMVFTCPDSSLQA